MKNKLEFVDGDVVVALKKIYAYDDKKIRRDLFIPVGMVGEVDCSAVDELDPFVIVDWENGECGVCKYDHVGLVLNPELILEHFF